MRYRIRVISTLIALPVLALWAVRQSPSVPTILASDETADFVLVDKSERRLALRKDGRTIRVYEIPLGGNPLGPKRREGDQRTPEGLYMIDRRNPDSSYHLSLHINYPNESDRAASAHLGQLAGGDIFIHGLPNYWPLAVAPKLDWTLGCIAVDNAEMEEIWRLVPDGTPIRIVP